MKRLIDDWTTPTHFDSNERTKPVVPWTHPKLAHREKAYSLLVAYGGYWTTSIWMVIKLWEVRWEAGPHQRGLALASSFWIRVREAEYIWTHLSYPTSFSFCTKATVWDDDQPTVWYAGYLWLDSGASRCWLRHTKGISGVSWFTR